MELLIHLLLILAVVAAGVYLKMYPTFPPIEKEAGITWRRLENFANPAVSPTSLKCIRRSQDAEMLLRFFPPCSDPAASPTEDATDRAELQLILNKLTCLDSDITNNGVKGHNTLDLPYNTSHDIEPLGNFLGRCLNNGTQQRDLDLVIDRYEQRGTELIKRISSRIGMDPKDPLRNYDAVLKTLQKSMQVHCLSQHSSLDRPFGPRDPGFMTPFSVEKLAPFTPTGK